MEKSCKSNLVRRVCQRNLCLKEVLSGLFVILTETIPGVRVLAVEMRKDHSANIRRASGLARHPQGSLKGVGSLLKDFPSPAGFVLGI